jgi:hypothetical protein
VEWGGRHLLHLAWAIYILYAIDGQLHGRKLVWGWKKVVLLPISCHFYHYTRQYLVRLQELEANDSCGMGWEASLAPSLGNIYIICY